MRFHVIIYKEAAESDRGSYHPTVLFPDAEKLVSTAPTGKRQLLSHNDYVRIPTTEPLRYNASTKCPNTTMTI